MPYLRLCVALIRASAYLVTRPLVRAMAEFIAGAVLDIAGGRTNSQPSKRRPPFFCKIQLENSSAPVLCYFIYGLRDERTLPQELAIIYRSVAALSKDIFRKRGENIQAVVVRQVLYDSTGSFLKPVFFIEPACMRRPRSTRRSSANGV